MSPQAPDAVPLFSLAGRVVVVTGGAKGIGLGIARAVARCGAHTVISGRDVGALARAEGELRALAAPGAGVLAVRADLTRAGDTAHLVERTLSRFGALHGWVNNAGSASPGDVGALLSIREDQWDRVVDLNLKWTFFAAQAAARAMGEAGGSIVNISSRSGSVANPNTGHYGAAKAGVENLTRTMAAEWGHRGIRVNAVAPGVVLTEELARTLDTEARRERQIATVPLRRLGTPDDIGPLCAYLLGDASAWTTGAVIPVHGGSPVPMGYLSYLRQVARPAPDAPA